MKTKNIIKQVCVGVLMFVLGILAVLEIFGIILFVVFRNADVSNLQPFEMATVSAIIGGFALAGGFSDSEQIRDLVFSLRRVGAVFIVATIAFFLFGMSLPLTEKPLPEGVINVYTLVFVISAYLGAFLFTAGTIMFLVLIPKLFNSEKR